VANTPANDLTPEILAKKAEEMFKGVKNAKVTVLDTKKMQQLKMGLILGVAQGSMHAPKFIVVEYSGGIKSEGKLDAPLILVGKGVTFDSGGIQLKPGSGSSIHEMHMDMSGGIVCLGALKAIVEMGLKKNVVCIVPAVENMISKEGYRPGDILTSMSGKTVEILNTDAEGRLILADALTYAQTKYKPSMIVDVATLTGASIVALGTAASAFMTNTPEYVMDMMHTSELTGEYHWPLPLWGEYAYVLKSDRADLANIASTEPRSAGSIAGGIFLHQFIDKKMHPDMRWVHIDMAPRMDSNGRDGLGKGSTGEPMRTLVHIAKNS
jgi:leucyl aminopeptidase